MTQIFKHIIYVMLFLVSQTFSQSVGEQKLLEMKNSFILGLTEKGFEIGAELMSRKEYEDVREDATFYIAEFFFTLSSQNEENTDYPNRAYTYYLVLQKEYPNSKYSNIVSKRINTLVAYFQNNALFRNLLDASQNEASIVKRKLEFTEKLFTINFPNPYFIFLEGNSNISSSEILSRYYDEIIVNNPEFEIYAIYYKIISKLAQLSDVDYISDGIFKFNKDEIDLYPTRGKYYEKYAGDKKRSDDFRLSLDNELEKINKKYPHHPLTLNLNLIFAKVFCSYSGEVTDPQIKKYLEFVIQNEQDKTHPRYLLTREFLLDNQFK